MKKKLLSALCLVCSCSYADINMNSVTYSEGKDYKLIGEEATIVSFDHVSEHGWGDVIAATDYWMMDNNATYMTLQISPRIAIADLNNGIIDRLFVATSYEAVSSQNLNYKDELFGIGASFDVPEPSYLHVNVYNRNNEATESQKQVTVYVGSPFMLFDQIFSFDAIVTKRSKSKDLVSDTSITASLSWNIGQDKSTWVGVEHVRWKNKLGQEDIKIPAFGIDIDTDETSTAFFVRRTF
jgi:nucleoside-specific outer membrane channel protein Tsx